MELIIKELTELEEKVVPALLEAAGNRRKWLFFGEIGAGKTTLIQTLCRHLGVVDYVTSPTFSLVNEYTYPEAKTPGGQALVHHLDLYRLKKLDEAIDIGIEEYLDDPWFCWIEWPELIAPLWPEEVFKINLQILEDSNRKILFL